MSKPSPGEKPVQCAPIQPPLHRFSALSGIFFLSPPPLSVSLSPSLPLSLCFCLSLSHSVSVSHSAHGRQAANQEAGDIMLQPVLFQSRAALPHTNEQQALGGAVQGAVTPLDGCEEATCLSNARETDKDKDSQCTVLLQPAAHGRHTYTPRIWITHSAYIFSYTLRRKHSKLKGNKNRTRRHSSHINTQTNTQTAHIYTK